MKRQSDNPDSRTFGGGEVAVAASRIAAISSVSAVSLTEAPPPFAVAPISSWTDGKRAWGPIQ